jgi:hypothetical protein
MSSFSIDLIGVFLHNVTSLRSLENTHLLAGQLALLQKMEEENIFRDFLASLIPPLIYL